MSITCDVIVDRDRPDKKAFICSSATKSPSIDGQPLTVCGGECQRRRGWWTSWLMAPAGIWRPDERSRLRSWN